VGKAIGDSGVPREDLCVTSKRVNSNYRPDHVRRSFDETLENLGLEQLDLFLVHWPLPTLYDGDYVSTWKAVTKFVAEGRLRSGGVSNLSRHPTFDRCRARDTASARESSLQRRPPVHDGRLTHGA
jgi:diketogulonate reductase-like aldo/keto reductase